MEYKFLLGSTSNFKFKNWLKVFIFGKIAKREPVSESVRLWNVELASQLKISLGNPYPLSS
jgi:hypothetical protein